METRVGPGQDPAERLQYGADRVVSSRSSSKGTLDISYIQPKIGHPLLRGIGAFPETYSNADDATIIEYLRKT